MVFCSFITAGCWNDISVSNFYPFNEISNLLSVVLIRTRAEKYYTNAKWLSELEKSRTFWNTWEPEKINVGTTAPCVPRYRITTTITVHITINTTPTKVQCMVGKEKGSVSPAAALLQIIAQLYIYGNNNTKSCYLFLLFFLIYRCGK